MRVRQFTNLQIFILNICNINNPFNWTWTKITTVNPFPHNYKLFLTPLQQMTLEHIATKGEIAHDEQFLLLPQFFQLYLIINITLICKVFSCRFVVCGKGLTIISPVHFETLRGFIKQILHVHLQQQQQHSMFKTDLRHKSCRVPTQISRWNSRTFEGYLTGYLFFIIKEQNEIYHLTSILLYITQKNLLNNTDR